jgi:2-C-methyl-D-erythritol 2,4-cyclodiphosphate synthase
LLRKVIADLAERGWAVNNIDATVVAQAPKLAPYISQMKSLLADDMNADDDAVNIKATTTEKLGYTGRKEGIAAHAVVLLKKATA